MASYLSLTPYLRNDLWAKEQINYAELTIEADPADVGRLGARVYFIKAVAVGSIESVVHGLATALLFVPYVLASLAVRFVGWNIVKGAVRQFHVSLGRTEGALLATAVAATSIVFTRVSGLFKNYLDSHLDQQWSALKRSTVNNFSSRVANTLNRLTLVPQEYQYRLLKFWTDSNNQARADRSWLALRLDHLEKRVKDFCDQVDINEDPSSKYERFEAAREDLRALAADKTRKLSALPITYTQVAEWKAARAEKMKYKALRMIWDQAARISDKYMAYNPKKFNRSAYAKQVEQYVAKVDKNLSSYTQQLQDRKKTVLTQWKDKAFQHDAQIAEHSTKDFGLQREQERLQWWVDCSKVLTDSERKQYESERNKLLSYLADPSLSSTQIQNYQARLKEVNGYLSVWNAPFRLSVQQRDEYEQKINELQTERNIVAYQKKGLENQRQASIYSIKMGALGSLEKSYFGFIHRYNGLVDEGGGILSNLEYLAQPSWYTKVWRPISRPVGFLVPKVAAKVSSILDPDI